MWKDPERPALRLHKKTPRPSMKAALKVVEEEEPPRKKGSKKERSSGSGIKRPITEPLEEEEPEARSEKTSKTNNTNKERKKGKAENPDKTDTKAEVKKEQESEKNVKKGSTKGSSSEKTAKESSLKRKNQHDDLAEVLRQFEDSDPEIAEEKPKRKLKPQTSGPTIDDDEMMRDFWSWREERAAEELQKQEQWAEWGKEWEGEEWEGEEEEDGQEDCEEYEACEANHDPIPTAPDEPSKVKGNKKKALAALPMPEPSLVSPATAPVPDQQTSPDNPTNPNCESSTKNASEPAPHDPSSDAGAAAPMTVSRPVVDPSQEDTQQMEIDLDVSQVGPNKDLLAPPPYFCKVGANPNLLPGLKDDYASEQDSDFSAGQESDADSELQGLDDSDEKESLDEAPEEAASSKDAKAPDDDKTINSSTHKKEYNKLARFLESNGDSFPQMAKKWREGDKIAKNKLLKEYVLNNLNPDDVESSLVWQASSGNSGNTRRMLLTVSQMRKAPYFFPKEKIRTIVQTKTPVKDEDAPDVKKAYRYWCNVAVVKDEFYKNESSA